ncbi:winged helix-turn-helix domain-containing protein [Maritimibacter sp. DP1N21-5]|uniref:winged helix-turn-helix domain-containing protein n=1 Tax=Maritimibacter sp. DP1N21-5 TaxID=2836867 RepID=UPI001C476B36|nr:response regulator transcription factor [Maritimibacter sp. DP1N21-5]MBV7410892.1 response regulator transcription factor [Maritimibacter sp. DP1N21-5]
MAALPETPVHLLIVVPHEETRKLLRTWLGRQGFLVTNARDADHAARLKAGLDFDLAVLDEDAGPLEFDGPIVYLGEGGHGEWVAKPVDGAVLTQRINAILDRTPPPDKPTPKVLKFGPFAYHVAEGHLSCEGERVKLTATEAKLMRALTATPNHPVTRAELGDEMGETEPGSRAVDVQITRLRRKIEADPKMAKYLQTVRGTGYVLMVE